MTAAPKPKAKVKTLREQANQLGNAALTKQQARERARQAIRRVCGTSDTPDDVGPFLRLSSFGEPSAIRWRYGRR